MNALNRKRLVCYDQSGKVVWSGYAVGISDAVDDDGIRSYTITARLYPDEELL